MLEADETRPEAAARKAPRSAGARLRTRCAVLAVGRILLVACICTPAGVRASGGGRPSAAARASALDSDDPAQVTAAIAALGERGGQAAVAALTKFVRRGQPDALTDRALEALGKTRATQALAVLSDFARHRRPAARRAAYAAIARIDGERANELLANGLRDSDSSVRGLCARSMGERGALSQTELLVRAFERGVPEAAAAVGRVATRGWLPRINARLGKAPLATMLAAYEPLLLRSDLGDDEKLDVVARLGEVASPSVKMFLERLLSEHDWSARPRLAHALAETARRIDARPRAVAGAPP